MACHWPLRRQEYKMERKATCSLLTYMTLNPRVPHPDSRYRHRSWNTGPNKHLQFLVRYWLYGHLRYNISKQHHLKWCFMGWVSHCLDCSAFRYHRERFHILFEEIRPVCNHCPLKDAWTQSGSSGPHHELCTLQIIPFSWLYQPCPNICEHILYHIMPRLIPHSCRKL